MDNTQELIRIEDIPMFSDLLKQDMSLVEDDNWFVAYASDRHKESDSRMYTNGKELKAWRIFTDTVGKRMNEEFEKKLIWG